MLEVLQTIMAVFAIGSLVGIILFTVGGLIYFTIMTIRDIPKTRATKAMNARVDAIRAVNRAAVEARLREMYGSK